MGQTTRIAVLLAAGLAAACGSSPTPDAPAPVPGQPGPSSPATPQAPAPASDVCPSGCAFSSIQAAVDAARPTSVIHVGRGVYQELVTLAKDGVTLEGGLGVELRGRGFSDPGGPVDQGSDRTVLLQVSGSTNVVRGFTLTGATFAAVAVVGSNNLLEEITVVGAWRRAISLGDGAKGNTVRYCEVYQTRHGGGAGVTGTPGTRTSGNRIERCLLHDNGRDASNNRVPGGISGVGDPAGGGNSDGGGSSKDCADEGPPNLCPDNSFVENISWNNVDDGFDNSLERGLLQGNISFRNGPTGSRGFKDLRYTPDNTYIGNVAFENEEIGLEIRAGGGGTSRVFHTTAIRNGQWDLSLKAQGGTGVAINNATSGARSGDSFGSWTRSANAREGLGLAGEPSVADLRLPDGTVAARWQFLYDRFRKALTPAPGSPLIDAGAIVPGIHCETADDSSYPPAASALCRHWRGRAPDIGAFEAGVP